MALMKIGAASLAAFSAPLLKDKIASSTNFPIPIDLKVDSTCFASGGIIILSNEFPK